MTLDPTPSTTVVGLGEMGSALAAALIDADHPTTVWNRSPDKAQPLVARGATAAPSIQSAVTAGELIVVCLFDHASVHEVLDPIAAELRGRAVVNLTTTTPDEARELAGWAAGHAIDYLDGAIMAVPAMIGGPGSAVFYSGAGEVFAAHGAAFELWGQSSFFGADAGLASLYDLAMLAGMYVTFAGFMHGAAMVGSEGVSATEFAALQTPFLAAMTGAFAGLAATIDARGYAGAGQQSLEFSDLTKIVRASTDQGVSAEVLQPVHEMIRRQIAAGHGKQGFARIFEELRSTR